ncbi:MAG: PrsW family intramembrane metalloprotease [Woeseiaceae bacterium]
MRAFPLLLPIILPLVFWAIYHYHKDWHLPEPPASLALCFCFGLLAAAISKGLYLSLEPLGLRYDAFALADENTLGLLAYAMLAIGPIEELAKMLPFLIVVIRFRAFDEPMDGLIYASFIGLGYAAAENVGYLEYLTPVEAAARGFAGPVVHILFASIWAYWISRARLARASITGPALAGFLLAAFLHGLYDFLVLLQPVVALPIATLLIVAIWIWRLRVMHELHQDAVRSETRR